MYDLIFLALVFGAFIFLLADIFLPYYWDEFKRKIVSLFLAIVLGLLCSYAINENDKRQEEIWNNGIHAECNGEWEFTNGSYYKGKIIYFYKCDKCNEIVEFDSNFTK